MSSWGRVLGTAGVVGGILGAAALGGMTAQRVAVRRYRASNDNEDGFDSLPSDRNYSVVAEDGVALHVEEVGELDAPLTVVFSHGWTLRSGAWHFQRLGLAGPNFGSEDAAGIPAARLVFYDHRSHGRSTKAAPGNVTLDYLASDLAAVIATAAPSGPIAIIGHSMGGMSLLTLAGRDPEFFARRVAGVGLVSTSASEVEPVPAGWLRLNSGNPFLPVVVAAASRYPGIFERGRASGARRHLADDPVARVRRPQRRRLDRRLPGSDDLLDTGGCDRGVRARPVRPRSDRGAAGTVGHSGGDHRRGGGSHDPALPLVRHLPCACREPGSW